MFVLAFVGLSSYALAQTSEVPTKKYSVATNSFWSNWFIQVGADWTSYYSDEEHGIHPRSVTPFKVSGSLLVSVFARRFLVCGANLFSHMTWLMVKLLTYTAR